MSWTISYAAGVCLIVGCSSAMAAKPVYRLNPNNHYVTRCGNYLPGSAQEQIRLRDDEIKLSLTGQSRLVNSLECVIFDGGQTKFRLTINGSSGAMVKTTIKYPNDPTPGSGYFFKDDLVPAAAARDEIGSSGGAESDVLAAIKVHLGENVARHTLAYSVRPMAKVILTDMRCPDSVPDPRLNGGNVAFLIFDNQPGALPGCYVRGMFGGGIDLKWANGYGDSVKLDDLRLITRGAARFRN
ncbi:hypothetical protein [Burkholderia cepacia]|uniref:hypothetical protein n=1 Tax=Burkholderia cepacia TaxID=292 RepID=UPI001CF1708E|nr:hypothetical protein [Burkholderia cepacia]MCA8114955.1 hypothetical protein [Burkholderia cepacia]MCA8401414.1 hypothetical protein [Burkholderia cepacia]